MSGQTERATTSATDAVGAGLEQFLRAITAEVTSIIAADRAHFITDLERLETMLGAVATELAEQRKESRAERGEMLAGLAGLSQQLSEYEALVPPAERVRIVQMVHDHETRLSVIEAWLKAHDDAAG